MDDTTTKNQQGVVVVLGAAGAVGQALSRDLAGSAELDLRLVDVDVSTIRDLASPRVEVLEADAFSPDGAEPVLRDASLLVNCLSLTHFDRVLQLAIDAGVDYTDLISEPSDEQAALAQARGIAVVPGLGLSPGLSNVLVSHAARDLTLQEAEISFVVYRTIAGSRGALDTTLWEGGEFCLDRNYFQDGKLVPAGPFDGRRIVDFGPEFGELEVFFRPHPEPKSLPKNFPSLRFAAVRGTWQPELMNDLRVLNKYGFLAENTIEHSADIIWDRCGGVTDPQFHGQGSFVVEARGTDAQGHRLVRTYTMSSTLQAHAYTMTGLAAAVGVRVMATHPSDTTGLVEPEAYFDPAVFLRALEEQGVFSVSWTDQKWTTD
jgi:saccharopine dehydrogenase-like NADP-dependent oxidoreductase